MDWDRDSRGERYGVLLERLSTLLLMEPALNGEKKSGVEVEK